MDMKITDVAGSVPLPGLSGNRIAFDPEQDPLGLAPVSVCVCMCVCVLVCV